MKLSSASLDDVHSELDVILRSDGRALARLLLRIASRVYSFHREALLTLLRLVRRWYRT